MADLYDFPLELLDKLQSASSVSEEALAAAFESAYRERQEAGVPTEVPGKLVLRHESASGRVQYQDIVKLLDHPNPIVRIISAAKACEVYSSTQSQSIIGDLGSTFSNEQLADRRRTLNVFRQVLLDYPVLLDGRIMISLAGQKGAARRATLPLMLRFKVGLSLPSASMGDNTDKLRAFVANHAVRKFVKDMLGTNVQWSLRAADFEGSTSSPPVGLNRAFVASLVELDAQLPTSHIAGGAQPDAMLEAIARTIGDHIYVASISHHVDPMRSVYLASQKMAINAMHAPSMRHPVAQKAAQAATAIRIKRRLPEVSTTGNPGLHLFNDMVAAGLFNPLSGAPEPAEVKQAAAKFFLRHLGDLAVPTGSQWPIAELDAQVFEHFFDGVAEAAGMKDPYTKLEDAMWDARARRDKVTSIFPGITALLERRQALASMDRVIEKTLAEMGEPSSADAGRERAAACGGDEGGAVAVNRRRSRRAV